jgi:cell division protein FtsN
MLGRILITSALVTTLSACALLQPFEGRTTQEGYFPIQSVEHKDPYWQRFYELEREIAQLKASNARLQQQLAPAEPVYLAAAAPAAVEVGDYSPATSVLDRVREQADRAIAALDRAIASLSAPTIETGPIESSPFESSPVTATATVSAHTGRTSDIQGNLIRNDEGEVVSQTTYSESRKSRYNYSVVYVYPEPQPWNAMWQKLEDADEKDKWRGVNANKTRYFIYVGAYFSQLDAEQRQQALFALVGERPDMRAREQEHTLAAK